MLKRIHIVGCPRSGTTLLMELMSTCFQNDEHCEHEVSIFDAIPIDEGIYFSKKPSDIKNLHHIYPNDKNLHLIYMVRDPRAVVTSKHHSNPDQYFCNYKAWKACDSAAQQYLDGGTLSSHRRFLQIRYEDLVESPDSVQRQIEAQFSFLKLLHLFSEFSEFAKPSESSLNAMNGLRPISQQSVTGWHQHLPRVKEQLVRRPAMAIDLIRLGYETDNNWQIILERIQEQVFPCRYSENSEIFKEAEKSFRMLIRSKRYLAEIKKNASP